MNRWLFCLMMSLMADSCYTELQRVCGAPPYSKCLKEKEQEFSKACLQEFAQYKNKIPSLFPSTDFSWGGEISTLKHYQAKLNLPFAEKMAISPQVSFDHEFQKYELGLGYKEADQWGSKIAFGVASDHPWENSRDLFFQGLYYYKLNASWTLTAFTSSFGPIGLIPLPGFLFFYRTSDLTMMIGLPLFVMAYKGWQLALTPQSGSLEYSYGPLYSKLSYDRHAYWKHNRLAYNDKIYLEESKTNVGLRLYGFDFSLGYLFGKSPEVFFKIAR